MACQPLCDAVEFVTRQQLTEQVESVTLLGIREDAEVVWRWLLKLA